MSMEAAWVKVAKEGDLSDGDMMAVAVDDLQIALYKVDGVLYATDNICTHAYAMLTDGWLESCIIECPLHGGQFDISTGAALCDPLEKDIRTYKVRRVDDDIEIFVAGD